MSFEDSYYVLKTLDNSSRILFLHVDEFVVMLSPIFLLAFVDSLWPIIFGPLIAFAYRKITKKFPTGRYMHKAYWFIPIYIYRSLGILKKIPGSHLREFNS